MDSILLISVTLAPKHSTFASLCCLDSMAISLFKHNAALMSRNLLATIDIPIPEPQIKTPNESLFLPKFFFYMIGSIEIPDLGYSRHFKELKEKKIPCPPIEIQHEIVSKLDRQSELVNGNRELIDSLSQKIQDRISKVWGE